jgi:Copine/C2 domain
LGNPCKIAVQIFDETNKSNHKSMGCATFDIAEVLGARGNSKARKLKDGGTLFCHVTESKGSGELRLLLSGSQLKNTEGFMSKSDPFFELYTKRDGAGGLTWDNVLRSDVVKNNLNPNWKEITIPLSVLNQGDKDKPIKISVYDYESSGNHVLMGSAETSVTSLQGLVGKTLPLKVKSANTGTLSIKKCEVTGVEVLTNKMSAASISTPNPPSISSSYAAAPPPSYIPTSVRSATFAEYISGGCELNVCVAIDFTGSNGDPRQPGTLHYMGNMNDYQKAISAIVGVLSKFDSDQMYPVYGFGAKYGGVVRHCFQCGPSSEVRGVQGVLDAYKQTFQSGLIMSGPTIFTEVLQTAAAKAMSSQEAARAMGRQVYTVLLILTDGAVTNPAETAQTLREISQAPLSVIIVGVGNADFSDMKFLDNMQGSRDIAQFVPFNEFCSSSVALTSETLNEIPAQLTGYFQSKNIPPLPPISRADHEIQVEPEQEIDLSLNFRNDDEIVVAAGGCDFATGFGK